MFPLFASRVLIVEDHPLFRESLARTCSLLPACVVVGQTDNASEAIHLCRIHSAEILLLDLELNGGDGFQVIEAVSKMWPRPKIIVLTAYCDEFTLLRLLQSPVESVLDKARTGVEELTQAIEMVRLRGHCRSGLLEQFHDATVRDPHSWKKKLSDREQLVLRLLGEGMTDPEVGGAFGSPLTRLITTGLASCASLAYRVCRNLLSLRCNAGVST